MTLIELRLTPSEAEIIRHRLHIPDAMAEVFGPSGDDIWGCETDDAAQERLESILSEIVTEFPGAGMILKFDLDNTDHVAVMNELVEGNTMGPIVTDMINQATDEKVHKDGVAMKKVLRQIETRWANAGLTAVFNI